MVIRNIPCYKCEICDEIQFTGDVVKRLESIISEARKRIDEVVVINYEKVA